mmetsp:Transcript_50579/g.61020  ORF Transcript_50579/g.61020 Transcript_50579/m.61020 type:complete len:86 (+) Transcript_50579:673-930(+)
MEEKGVERERGFQSQYSFPQFHDPPRDSDISYNDQVLYGLHGNSIIFRPDASTLSIVTSYRVSGRNFPAEAYRGQLSSVTSYLMT